METKLTVHYVVTKITQALMRLVSRMLAIGPSLENYNG